MSAKALRVEPISAQDARVIVSRYHYSGKSVSNSQLHFGVFMNGRCEGAMQFGPPMDKRKLINIVDGTGWNSFLELNRMAFSERLPRNSESRALSVAFRIMRKHYPHIEWVVSFADGTQCGDGTIYRAAGFVLTGIRKNTTIWKNKSGDCVTDIAVKSQPHVINRLTRTEGKHVRATGGVSMRPYVEAGYAPIPGWQLRYVYFINEAARARLSVPIIPFTRIDEMGAGMYKGQPRSKQAMVASSDTAAVQRRPDRSSTST